MPKGPQPLASMIVVAFAEPQEPGFMFPRHRNDWPFHITLVPWFDIDEGRDVEPVLEEVARAASPFRTTLGEFTHFGPKDNVPVYILKDQAELKELHDRLLAGVLETGARLHVARWIGENFRAHITQHDGANMYETGDIAAVTGFYLVRLIDRPEGQFCEIIKRCNFAGNENQT
jgi:2'-5' RNA ligase